jgi:hypothetical protein
MEGAGWSNEQDFPPHEARRLLDRLEIHHTPYPESWLHITEIVLRIISTP